MLDKAGLTKLMEARKSAYLKSDNHPDGSCLATRMQEEIADVLAAIDLVIDNFALDPIAISDLRELKVDLFLEWQKEN